MKKKTEFQEFIERLQANGIASDVDAILKDQVQPQDSLEPKHIWKEKLHENLTEFLSTKPSIDKMERGLNIIFEDLNSIEKMHINEEWQHGVENWINKTKLALDDVKELPVPECLFEIMEISEDTLSRFYQAGNKCFELQDYQKASDVFHTIVSIDPRRFNAWLAFGLSEAHLQHWDQALICFSMASVMDIASPYPYIYSLQCCLKKNRKDEAKIYQDLAKKAIEDGDFSNKDDLLIKIKF